MGVYLPRPCKDKESEDGGDLNSSTTRYGLTAMQGWRQYMEDAHLAEPVFSTGATDLPPVGLFGVFDGHGGSAVSAWVARHFPDILRSELQKLLSDAETAKVIESKGNQDSKIPAKSWILCEALQRAFLTMDLALSAPKNRQELKTLHEEGEMKRKAVLKTRDGASGDGGDGLNNAPETLLDALLSGVQGNGGAPFVRVVEQGGQKFYQLVPGKMNDGEDDVEDEDESGKDNNRDDDDSTESDFKCKKRKPEAPEEPKAESSETSEQREDSPKVSLTVGASTAAQETHETAVETAPATAVITESAKTAEFPSDETEVLLAATSDLGRAASTNWSEATDQGQLRDDTIVTSTAIPAEKQTESRSGDKPAVEEDAAGTAVEQPGTDETEGETGKIDETDDASASDASSESNDRQNETEKMTEDFDADDFYDDEEDGPGKPYHPECCGTTAIVAAVVDFKPNPILITANAGDSRAVLSRNGRAVPLSNDHKPQLRRESERIARAGGWVKNGRVDGNLNLSRSIGDLFYKRDTRKPAEEQKITAFPDVRVTLLTPDDEFLIIACDGIWDCLRNQEAVDLIGSRLKEVCGGNSERFNNPGADRNVIISQICEEICDQCLSENPLESEGVGCDNMTLMVVLLNRGLRDRGIVTSIDVGEARPRLYVKKNTAPPAEEAVDSEKNDIGLVPGEFIDELEEEEPLEDDDDGDALFKVSNDE